MKLKFKKQANLTNAVEAVADCFAGGANDSVKINVEQIIKLMSPGTEVKTI